MEMNKTVFFVDDEKNVLNSVKRLFRNSDLDIFVFQSPFEMFKCASEHSPAVVVSDYRMPEMSGVELLEKISILFPSSIRIILSAFTDIAITESAINKSIVNLFISKPWDEDELLSEVENAVKIFNSPEDKKTGYGVF
ncbi:MAG: response regulator [Desulfobacteraceae bacterium]|jgi:FixJ family two-component response regulator